jgi:hypothetical protein
MTLGRIAAFVLLGVMGLAPCAGVCVGLTSSTHARMACCVDKSADEAAMCCASAEGRQNAESAAPAGVVALPPSEPITLRFATDLRSPSPAAAIIDSQTPTRDDSARYVLLSVFLI